MAYKDVIEQAAATTGHAHGFGHGEGKTPEERFADLQEIAATYLSPEEEATLVEGSSFEVLEDGTLCEALAVAHGVGQLDLASI